MLSLKLILELAYWTPLTGLLLSSLGLIGLKRVSGLSPWAQRLVAPPVFFVAVPIATLVAGLELVAWSALFTWLDPFAEGLGIAALAIVALRLVDEVSAGVHDNPALAAIAPLVFCVAMFATGYSLGRTLWWKQRLDRPFSRARHVGKALILLLAFAWVFACNRSFILMLGASMNLRIVCATSCDQMIGLR
jgi:hypothetical protein